MYHPSPLVRKRKIWGIHPLEEFVKLVVEEGLKEVEEYERSKVLLLNIKEDIIKYFITEFNKVEPGKFVEHVCGFTNLEQTLVQDFTKCHYFVEKFSQTLEEQRNNITNRQGIQKIHNLVSKMKNRQIKENPQEKPNPKPPTSRSIPVDPRPVPVQYKPPPSEFADDVNNDSEDTNTNQAPSPPADLAPPQINNHSNNISPINSRLSFHREPVVSPTSVTDILAVGHNDTDGFSNASTAIVAADEEEDDDDEYYAQRARPMSHYTKRQSFNSSSSSTIQLPKEYDARHHENERSQSNANEIHRPNNSHIHNNSNVAEPITRKEGSSRTGNMAYRNSPIPQAYTSPPQIQKTESNKPNISKFNTHETDRSGSSKSNIASIETKNPENGDHSNKYRSIFDKAESSEEENEEPTAKKKRGISFASNIKDNEGNSAQKYPDQFHQSGTVALNPAHRPVDLKVKVLDANEDSHSAYPNQPGVVATPRHLSYRKWPVEDKQKYEDDILDAFHNFRCNEIEVDSQERYRHLIIKDSILGPVDFREKYKQVEEIYARYPKKLTPIIDALETEIDEGRNDYLITNILIAVGFDMLCYEPDFKEAAKNTTSFINEFATDLRQAFDKKGPPRFKQMKPMDDGTYPDNTFIPEMPKIIILTIPYIDSHPVAETHKDDIKKMNKVLRSFVDEKKDRWFRKYNQIIELFDWQEEAANFNKCSVESMKQRYQVLTKALSERYLMFMRNNDDIV